MSFKRKALILLALFVALTMLFSCNKTDSNENSEESVDNSSLEELSSSTNEESSSEESSSLDEESSSLDEAFVGVTFSVDTSSSQRGFIDGSIVFRGIGGYFSLHFGNEDGKLENYTPISERIAIPKRDVFEYELSSLILPPEATTIVVTGSSEEYVLSIDSDYTLLGEDVFVFGALSDVHYNRYNYSGTGDDGVVYFDNALDFLDGVGVDLVAIAGDISNNGKVSALTKYNSAIKDRSYPVYTVTGNHDVPAISSGDWVEYINTDIYDKTNTEVLEIAENQLDFVYAPSDLDGDVFVFLSQVRWEYNTKESTILDSSQLEWLEDVLEKYKDETVYLFFHTFLCGTDGQKHTGVGNIKNPGGYTYDLPYTYGNTDEVEFRRLMKEYKNVVYFSGHSHWMFEMECYNEITNFSNFDGEYGYMVHVPSVTEPRYVSENASSRESKNGEYSQGWIIYDYGDISIFLPVDFISGTYYTEYMEIVLNN